MVALATILLYFYSPSVRNDSTQVIPLNARVVPTDSLIRNARTVTVYADVCATECFNGIPTASVSTVDEFMVQGNATLIARAAMAGEAMVRGFRGGQLTTSIDGMKIHSACVDKMDPTTAYVELENVGMLELTAGSGDLRYGQNIGGALNFKTQQPRFSAPLSANTELQYQSNAQNGRLRVDIQASNDETASRLGYTLRNASDYSAGQNTRISGSGFTKHNVSFVGAQLLSDIHTLSVQGIYDLVLDLGYPSLIMDTRKAEGMIGSATLSSKWDANHYSSVKIYANAVNHAMDDFDRSKEEISIRPFMPNMYMPMTGITRTFGFLGEYRISNTSSIINFTLDATGLFASAIMTMIPFDTTASTMVLTNIGDAHVYNLGANAVYDVSVSDISIRTSLRLDVNSRSLHNQSSVEIFQAYYPNTDIDQFTLATSFVAGATKPLTEFLSTTLTLGSSERLPTYMEAYAFYVYDPQANIVTIGRPDLTTERSYSADIRMDHRAEFFVASAGVFTQYITRYIAPVVSTVSDPSTDDVRNIGNIGDVTLSGIEASAAFTIAPDLTVLANATYTYGYAIDVRDNLPFISPITGMLRLVAGDSELHFEGRVRFASHQTTISTKILPEDSTPSWATFDVISRWNFTNSLTLQLTLTNIFDTLYHEHSSINNLSARGRSFNISVQARI